MASFLQPSNSKVRVSPYSQRLLMYGIDDSKVYLSKATNTLLSSFTLGNNSNFLPDSSSYTEKVTYESRDSCILNGLETTFSLSSNTLTVIVAPGTLIADTTLLIFPEETELSLDLSDYGNSTICGKIIISVYYQWIDSTYESVPKLKMSYLDPNDNFSIEPNGWWNSQDKLVINVFEFSKNTNGQVISSSITSAVPNPCRKLYADYITIKGYPYEIAPLPRVWYELVKTVEQYFSKKLVKYIPGAINPDNMPGSTIEIPVDLVNVSGTSITSVMFDMVYDTTLLESPSITSGPVATSAGKSATFTETTSGRLSVEISGVNMNIIGDGIVAYISFKVKRTVPQNTVITFTYENYDAVDIYLNHPIMNEEGTARLDISDSFTVTRPTGTKTSDPSTFDDWDHAWNYSGISNEPEPYMDYYADVDISDIGKLDVMVQCFIDNFVVSPAGIKHIDENTVRIWMPQSFIDKDPIPEMKLIITG